MNSGWVASDATSHVLSDANFNPTSLVSVAIAVDDREEFDSEYRKIVSNKCEKFGIPLERPVIKDEEINKYVAEWKRNSARKELVEELLQIEVIANVHFTETTLGQPGDKMIPGYQLEEDKKRLLSPSHLRDEIFPYYNLVSIWDYYDRIADRFQHSNVMVDDFNGKESYLWHHIGSRADQLYVVPKGDRIYPLLSLADLTMEYVKQEVDDWSDTNILDLLVDVTPGDSAFAEAYSIDDSDKLQIMAPLSTKAADTQMHYPHPVIYIDTGSWHQKEIKALDIYDILCEWAYQNEGCLKFIAERDDRDYMRRGDYIVCMDSGSVEEYKRYESLNDIKGVTVLSAADAMDELTNSSSEEGESAGE